MEASRASYNDSVINDFADDSRKKQREAGLPTVLLLSALIYMGLYGFFIFGNAVYMYSDVGSDSLSSSYPIITMLARLYREKDTYRAIQAGCEQSARRYDSDRVLEALTSRMA